ncbi:hypothetical protein [Actinomadura miaoliensis]|uniref:Uncharacterized protein n=1 Tax=Actinomadura miaoliensis TaxID=430685 RepID=A0ABP7X412_9ACTN
MATTASLSPAMRAALIAAVGTDGCYLSCRAATTQALVRRGLAVHDLDNPSRWFLTPEGRTAGARLLDRDRSPLQPGDVVVYHGSIDYERGNEYVVLEETKGRYRIADLEDQTYRLRQVRRESMSRTGRRVDVEEEPSDLTMSLN